MIQARTHLHICVNPDDQFQITRDSSPAKLELREELPKLAKTNCRFCGR